MCLIEKELNFQGLLYIEMENTTLGEMDFQLHVKGEKLSQTMLYHENWFHKC